MLPLLQQPLWTSLNGRKWSQLALQGEGRERGPASGQHRRVLSRLRSSQDFALVKMLLELPVGKGLSEVSM